MNDTTLPNVPTSSSAVPKPTGLLGALKDPSDFEIRKAALDATVRQLAGCATVPRYSFEQVLRENERYLRNGLR